MVDLSRIKKRIRVFSEGKNIGVTFTKNLGISLLDPAVISSGLSANDDVMNLTMLRDEPTLAFKEIVAKYNDGAWEWAFVFVSSDKTTYYYPVIALQLDNPFHKEYVRQVLNMFQIGSIDDMLVKKGQWILTSNAEPKQTKPELAEFLITEKKAKEFIALKKGGLI